MEEKIMPRHIAIIMDGNRRWAKEHKLDGSLGHKKGAEVLETIAKYCNKIGLEALTVYAFSTENWKRTKEEVGAILILLNMYLDKFLKTADLENIKLRVLGDREKNMPEEIKAKMIKMEEKTKNNTGLKFNIAFISSSPLNTLSTLSTFGFFSITDFIFLTIISISSATNTLILLFNILHPFFTIINNFLDF